MGMFGQETKEGRQTSQLRNEGVDVDEGREGWSQSLINISRLTGREAKILDINKHSFPILNNLVP